MGTTSVQMPEDLMQRLDAAAQRLRRSKGWIINDAVREYLEREEQRVGRLEDTKAALSEVEAGDLIDGEDVLAWLDSWGTEQEREPPH